VEFIIVMRFDTMTSVRQFAGADYEAAVDAEQAQKG